MKPEVWIFGHDSVLCSVSIGASYMLARSVGEERYSAHLWFRKTLVNLPLIVSSCELSYTFKITRFHKCSRKWQPTPVFFLRKLHRQSEPGGLESMESQRVRHNLNKACRFHQILSFDWLIFYCISSPPVEFKLHEDRKILIFH